MSNPSSHDPDSWGSAYVRGVETERRVRQLIAARALAGAAPEELGGLVDGLKQIGEANATMIKTMPSGLHPALEQWLETAEPQLSLESPDELIRPMVACPECSRAVLPRGLGVHTRKMHGKGWQDYPEWPYVTA